MSRGGCERALALPDKHALRPHRKYQGATRDEPREDMRCEQRSAEAEQQNPANGEPRSKGGRAPPRRQIAGSADGLKRERVGHGSNQIDHVVFAEADGGQNGERQECRRTRPDRGVPADGRPKRSAAHRQGAWKARHFAPHRQPSPDAAARSAPPASGWERQLRRYSADRSRAGRCRAHMPQPRRQEMQAALARIAASHRCADKRRAGLPPAEEIRR